MPRTKTRTEEPEQRIDNPYLPTPVKVTMFRREAPDCFHIRTSFKGKYMPGQFFQIYLPGYGEVPISVASYSPDFLEFNIREVGNVTNKLAAIKKGDTLHIRGPYGNGYPMEGFHGKKMLLIGGGSGVAPLKGIISYVERHRNEFGEVNIFFGYRSPDEILFKEEMKQWKRKFQLHMSVDENPKKIKLHFDVCFVTHLIEKAKLAPEGTMVFICGPPVMLNITVGILKSKGFSDDQIYISSERLMNCALGVCGHCMIHGRYTCLDGPVFRFDQIKDHHTH